MRATLLLLPWLVLGCDRFARWPDGSASVEGDLWDPDLLSATDGLYVVLPHAGDLVSVDTESGEANAVDLGGASPVRQTLTPDEAGVLVASTWIVCKDEDPDIKTVSDCDEEDQRTASALDLVRDGAIARSYDVPVYMNAFAYSHSGTVAVAYLDEDGYDALEDYDTESIIDLDAVSFLNLESGDESTVSVGFAANNILFTEDDGLAVVLSRSTAVVVDLSTFEVTVRYHLTLDADEELDPLAAQLTPDGRYALVSIRGSSDLYKLDLEVESIDILSLDDDPSDMVVDTDTDQTLLVYRGASRVDLLDHEDFSIESVELDVPATAILDAGGSALLYNDASSSVNDVYELDLSTHELHEYVLNNPVDSLQLSESGAFALAILSPSYDSSGTSLDDYAASRWGLGVIDLANQQARSLTLSGEPVGLALVDDAETTYALLLLDGSEELLVVDLRDPTVPTTIDLPAAPLGIGAMPDDRFFITHDSALGLVSFLVPETGELSSVSGFGAVGLFVDDTLAVREEL